MYDSFLYCLNNVLNLSHKITFTRSVWKSFVVSKHINVELSRKCGKFYQFNQKGVDYPLYVINKFYNYTVFRLIMYLGYSYHVHRLLQSRLFDRLY